MVEEKSQRGKRVVAGLVALAVLAGVVMLSVLPQQQGASGATLVRRDDGSMLLAKPGATAPVLDVYEDFDCPFCKQLHDTSGARLKGLADAGAVAVVFHVVTIFQDEPMRSNSIRAAAAARCVPAASWLAFRDQVYGMQPAPHGTASGFTAEELVAAGERAGGGYDGFAECVSSQKSVDQHLTESTKVRLDGTPTLLLNGEVIQDVAELERALAGQTV